MIKSKFKLKALLIPLLILSITGLSIFILTKNLPMETEKIRWIDMYIAALFLFTWVWLVFGELRTKLIIVTIKGNQVEKRNFIGLKQYNFKDFDGFQTSILTSKGEDFEYLYFIKNGEKIIKISDAYHKNYSELKNIISSQLKDLGKIKFSYLDELKEVIK
jgi:hypothetical protein